MEGEAAYGRPKVKFRFSFKNTGKEAIDIRHMQSSCGIILLFLTLTFTGAIVSAWIRGIDLNCGCLGMLMQTTDIVWMLGRNVLIVVVLSVLVYGEFAKINSPHESVYPPETL